MTIACDVYRNSIKLGSGTATAGSATIASYTGYNPGLGNDVARTIPKNGRVTVVMTAGNNPGATMRTKVVTDGGTSLTLANAAPFT